MRHWTRQKFYRYNNKLLTQPVFNREYTHIGHYTNYQPAGYTQPASMLVTFYFLSLYYNEHNRQCNGKN